MTFTLILAGIVWHKLGQIDEDEDNEDTTSEQLKVAVQQVKVSSGAEKVGPDGAGTEEVAGSETRAVEEVDTEDDEDGLVPEDQPENAWFIPLGLAKEMPKTFYKGTDPEWVSFVEFSKDKTRNAKVRRMYNVAAMKLSYADSNPDDLATTVGFHIGNQSVFQQFLGTPVVTGKYWLDVDFPVAPPPEYERAGLEITDDYIAYIVRPVDATSVARLRQALWPTAVGSSIWASFSMFMALQTARIRKALNLEEPESSDKKQGPAGWTTAPALDPQANASNPRAAADDTQVKPPNMASAPPTSDPGNFESGKPWILRPLPSVPKPNTELNMGTTALKKSLAKNWKSTFAPIAPPRGTVVISGLVEVFGPLGISTLDVRAAYHPAENKVVAMSIGIRRLQKRKVAPRVV
jgi:hypothetical protein